MGRRRGKGKAKIRARAAKAVRTGIGLPKDIAWQIMQLSPENRSQLAKLISAKGKERKQNSRGIRDSIAGRTILIGKSKSRAQNEFGESEFREGRIERDLSGVPLRRRNPNLIFRGRRH